MFLYKKTPVIKKENKIWNVWKETILASVTCKNENVKSLSFSRWLWIFYLAQLAEEATAQKCSIT